MSEYTRYFAVHGLTPQAAKARLIERSIHAVVDDTESGTWVVVSAPARSGFHDGQFVYDDRWAEMRRAFSKVCFFWVDEGQRGWSVRFARDGAESVFESTGDEVDAADVERLGDYFEVPAARLRPVAAASLAHAFCACVGLPYQEMNDQNHCDFVLRDARVAVLASELDG